MKKLICVLLTVLLLGSMLTLPTAAEQPYAGKTVLLATGNMRGNFLYEYALVKALKDDYIAKGAEVVLVDVGNFLQGSRYANADRGLSIYKLMDACGYDVANMGLAEFGYADATTGYPYHGNFRRYYTQKMLQEGTAEITYNVNKDGTVTATLPAREPATFRTICSRYFDEKGWYSFEPSAVVTTDSGLKLLFLADTDDDLHRSLPDGALGDESLSVDTEGYDLVVTLSNAPTAPTAGEGELVIHAAEQDGPYTSDMGYLLKGWCIDNETGALLPLALDVTTLTPDAEVLALVEAMMAADPEALFTSTLVMEGRDSVSRAEETNFGDLVTDALCWYAQNYIDGWNKDLPLVAIQNGGNLDNFLYTGEVTAADLLRALPFSPMGVGVLELTGEQLLETLEAACQSDVCPGFAQVSGLQYTIKRYEPFDGGEAYGKFYRADSIKRVEITEVNGQPFDPEATYAVVADNFLMSGNDTYYTMKEAKNAGAAYVNNGGGVKTRNIVALYVQQEQGGILGGNPGYEAPQGRITNIWEKPDEPQPASFDDVPADAYYAEAVNWAVNHDPQITNGTGEGKFSPDAACTRAQAVTFLWRAKGSPEPEALQSNCRDGNLPSAGERCLLLQRRNGDAPVGDGTFDVPFDDIQADDYYFKAVLWAVENGVTTGTGDGKFSPNAKCTRGQIVTFLWRAEGCPEIEGSGNRDQGSGDVADGSPVQNPFGDVKENDYFYKAVLWAVENGVTTGTGEGKFSPNAKCTRGQIVTFLYRDLA